jgi:hypothetical protein
MDAIQLIVRRLMTISIVLFLIVMGGCGKSKSDHYVLTSNAKEIKPDAKVMWQGVHIGSVSRIRPDQGKIRIDLKLLPKYKNSLRVGVKAKVVRDYSTPSISMLKLYGGNDPSLPLLEKYTQIQEASFFDTLSTGTIAEWLWSSHAKWLLLACIVLLVFLWILIRILKGLIRLGFVILLLCLIAISLYIAYDHWNKYKSTPPVPYTELLVTIENSLKNDETRQIWDSVRSDVMASMKKTTEMGIDQLGPVKSMINDLIQNKINELQSMGKDEIINQIKQDQSTIIEILSPDE